MRIDEPRNNLPLPESSQFDMYPEEVFAPVTERQYQRQSGCLSEHFEVDIHDCSFCEANR